MSSIRELRIRSFWARDQRLAEMFSPAKWTTVSKPSNSARSMLPVVGSQLTEEPSALVCGRTSRTTSSPFRRSRETSALPIRPVEPETRIFIGTSRSSRMTKSSRAAGGEPRPERGSANFTHGRGDGYNSFLEASKV